DEVGPGGADADYGLDVGGAGEGPQVEPLGQAAGDQHHRRVGGDGGQGGVGGGGLRVVDVVDPADGGDDLAAVRAGTEGTEDRLHPFGDRTAVESEDGGGGHVDDVGGVGGAEVFQRHRESRQVQAPAFHPGPAFGEMGGGHRVEHRAGGADQIRRPFVVGVVDEEVVFSLALEDARLGGGVGLRGAVPVEVVLCHVEEGGGHGMEAVDEAELEARHLDDGHLPVAVGCVGQRRADVSDGHGPDPR